MADLKPGWKWVKFGDVVRQVKDRVDPETSGLTRYVAGEHMDTDDLRVRRWGEIGDGILGPAFHMRFKPGQVLYGSRRTYLRKVAVPEFEGVCANTTFVLESANPSVLLPELLPFIMRAEEFQEHSQRESKGSVNPYVNFSDLTWYEFALPPLEGQRRIADLLCCLRNAVEAARQAAEAFAAVRLRIYADATVRGLHSAPYSDSPLGSVPANWDVVTLGDAAQVHNHLRKPINATERSRRVGQYAYYGPTGILDHINEYRVDGTYVLLGEDGDHFLKWPTWSMTQLAVGRFNVNNHAHLLRGSDRCRTEWLFHFFRHRSVREWLTKQGAGRLKLKKSTLERMWIALPPLREQDDLIAVFESLDARLQLLQERVNSLVALLTSALDLLNGSSNVH